MVVWFRDSISNVWPLVFVIIRYLLFTSFSWYSAWLYQYCSLMYGSPLLPNTWCSWKTNKAWKKYFILSAVDRCWLHCWNIILKFHSINHLHRKKSSFFLLFFLSSLSFLHSFLIMFLCFLLLFFCFSFFLYLIYDQFSLFSRVNLEAAYRKILKR